MPSLIDNLLAAYGTKQLSEIDSAVDSTAVTLRDDPSQLIRQGTAIDLLMQPERTRNALAGSLARASSAATAENKDPLATTAISAGKATVQAPLALASLVPVAGGAVSKALGYIAPEGSTFDQYAKRAVDVYSNQISTLAGMNKDLGEGFENLAGVSDETKQARRVDALISKTHDDANVAAYQADLDAGDNKVIADIKDVGRQMGTAVTDAFTNETTLSDLTGSGIGSLAPSMGIMRGLETVGKIAITKGLVKKESEKLIERASGAIAVGSQEGGSQALQTAQGIIAMPDADLIKTSKDYAKLRETLGELDAKKTLAGRAGITAGVWTSALAIGVGAAVDIGKFIKNPLGVGKSIGQIGRNIGKETTEEALQNPSGQFAENLALQQNVDPSQSLTEGLPRAAVEGAIAGFGTAGSVGAPGAVISGTVAATRKAGQALSNKVNSITEETKKASPVSTDNISKRIQEGMAAAAGLPDTPAPVTGIPRESSDGKGDKVSWIEEKNTNDDTVSTPSPVTKVKEAFNLSDNEKTLFKATTGHDVEGNHTRADLLDYLGQLFEEEPSKSSEILSLTSVLIKPVEDLSGEDISNVVDSITDPIVKTQIQSGIQGLQQLKQSPGFNKILDVLKQRLDSGEEVSTPVSDATPDAQVRQSADAITFAATQDIKPEMGNQVENILKHKSMSEPSNAEAKAKLQLIKQYLDAYQAAAQIDTTTAPKTTDDVSANIRSTNFDGRSDFKSVLDHLKEATKSLLSGNLEQAKVQVGRDLKNLATTLNNKVAALNTSLDDNGKAKPYEAWNPANNAKKFFTQSKRPMSYMVGEPASIAFADRVSKDTHVAVEAYNQMVNSHPELGLEPITETQLTKPQMATLKVEPKQPVISPEATKTAPTAIEPAVDVTTPTAAAESDTAPTETPKSVEPVKKVEPVAETTVEPKAEPKKSTPVQITEPKNLNEVLESIGDLELDAEIASLESDENLSLKGEERLEWLKQEQEARADKTSLHVEPVQEIVEPVKQSLTARGIKFFKELASISKKRTNVPEGISALDHVLQQLSNTQVVKDLIGSKNKDGDIVSNTIRLYNYLLTPGKDKALNLQVIAASMQSLMNTFLDSKGGKSGKTVRDLLNSDSGVDPTQWNAGHHLVLLNEDGTYNQEILESAVLASIHWFMNDFVKDGNKVARDNARKYLTESLNIANPTEKQINTVASSMNTDDVVISLAKEIKAFLGIKFKDTAPLADTQGMLQALAADLLTVMKQSELLQETPLEYSISTPTGLRKAHTNFYSQSENIKKYFKSFPFDKSLVGALINKDYTKPYYSADDAVPIHNTVKGTDIPLTSKQTTAQDNMQKVVFDLEDSTATDMFEDIGEKGYLSLLGSPERTEKNTNKNHLNSIKGTRTTIENAANKIVEMINKIRDTGKGIKFQIIAGGNNRYMFQSPYNPQSDKMVRHVLTATKSILDLSDPTSNETRKYLKTIAQMLGFDKASPSQNIQDTLDALAGPLQPAVQVMKDYLGDRDGKKASLVADLKKALQGQEIDHAKLAAIRDFARYELTKDKSSFETALSFESDGKTDGPYNLINLFGWGKYTPNEIALLGKGGMSFGSKKSLHELSDKIDFYHAVASGSEQLTKYITQNILKQSNTSLDVRETLNAFFHGSNKFLKNFSFEEHLLEYSRNLVKKGVTGATYAEGSASLSRDLANKIVNSIYEAISYGTLTEQDINLIDILSSSRLVFDPKTKIYSVVKNSSKTTLSADIKKDPLDFTMEDDRMRTLASNMKILLSDPIHQAMDGLYGDNIKESRNLSVMASSIQSNVYADAFIEELNNYLINNSDGTNKSKRQLLTQKAINDIVVKLRPLQQTFNAEGVMVVVAADQLSNELLLGMGNKTGHAGKISIASGSDGSSFKSSLMLRVPAPVKVKYLANITQALGDGAMQTGIWQSEATKSFQTYDGINSSIDTMDDIGLRANEASYQATLGNGVKPIAGSFSAMLTYDKGAALNKYLTNLQAKATRGALNFQEQRLVETIELVFPNLSMTELPDILMQRLQTISDSIDKRQQAKQTVPVSVDHMAGAEQPFVSHPDEQSNDSRQWSDEEAAAELNTAMIFGLDPKNHITTQPIKNTIDTLLEGKNLTKSQKLILNVLKSLGILDTVKTVSNVTLTDINKLRADKGLSAINDIDADGFFAQDENTVYLLGDHIDPEIAIHELIHAATFQAVQAHYANGKSVYSASIVAIENLMSSFMDQALTSGDSTAEHVYTVIEEYLKNDNKAAALNEFMAWGLTNESVAELLSTKVDVPILSKISNKARFYIHKLINSVMGIKFNVNENMLNSLQFHTLNIARHQTQIPNSTSSLLANNILFHNSTSNNQSNLRDTLLTKLSHYLDTNNVDPIKAMDNRNKFVEAYQYEGKQISDHLSTVFNLNTEESTTAQVVAATLLGIGKLDTQVNQGFLKAYREFLDQATIDNFRDPTITDPQQQEYVAQERFAAVTGKTGLFNSKITDRSSLVPSFIALAVTSPTFKEILLNMERTKEEPSGKSVLDEKFNSLTLDGMEKLADMLSGSKKSTNLLDAVNGVMNRWTDAASNENSAISQITEGITYAKDTSNDIVAKGIDRLSDGLKVIGDSEAPNTFQNAATAAGNLLDTKNTEQAKEGIYRLINDKALPEALSSLIHYVVGRTDMNGAVYDMVKKSRALIARVRTIYRESIPKEIASQFSTLINQTQQSAMRDGLARIDVGSLMEGRTVDQVINLLSDDGHRAANIKDLNNRLTKLIGTIPSKVNDNIDNLVKYLTTGETVSGMSMNAYAIAAQAGTNNKISYDVNQAEKLIDSLITLRAFDTLPTTTKESIQNLLSQEKNGISFVISTLNNLRNREIDQGIDEATRLNGRKGFFPGYGNVGSIIVESDSEYTRLIEQGYTRVGDYKTSSADPDRTSKGYYVSTMNARAAFNQGALQTVVASYNGFRIDGRNTLSLNAGVSDLVDSITKSISNRSPSGEALLPIYDGTGKITGYIRDVDHNLERMYQHPGKFFDSLGSWLGRQNETSLAKTFNQELANKLKDMFDKDTAHDSTATKGYINLFEGTKDKITADAIRNIPQTAKQALIDAFGSDPVMIRKEMLDNVIGTRAASVRDIWTGNSRLSAKTQEHIKNGLTVLLGPKAYQYAVKAEDITQSTVSSLRNLIVIKSVIVPAGNMVSNIFQLSMRGVNMMTMPKKLAQALSEAHQYTQMEQQAIKLEARLAAARPGSPVATRLQAQLKTIEESKKAMKIWPLIQNGELSTIADLGMSSEDLDLTSGDLDTWISNQVDKLPPGTQTLLRYGTISKDTALYRGLEKATLYGDFIAKAVLYEHYMEKENQSSEDALKHVTEEFVNYDVQMGRTRGYLENMGLVWFSNYKLGSIKVALDIMRKNPLHALTGYIGLQHTMDTGSVLSDNAFNKLVDGSLFRSFGPGQGIRAPALNPFIQLLD